MDSLFLRRISVICANDDNRRIKLEWALKIDKVNHLTSRAKISEVKLVRKPGREFRLLNYQISAPLLFCKICPHPCGYEIRSYLKGVIQLRKKHLS